MSSRSFEPSLPREQQKQRSRDRVVNLLLHGIIAANPGDPTDTIEARISRAREALLGEKPKKGRKAIREDVKLFPLIEEVFKYETDKMKTAFLARQQPEVKAEWTRIFAEDQKPTRRIAKEHLAKFAKPSVTPESTEDWIRKTLTALKLTTQDMADLEGLFYGDSPKAERLRRVFYDLKFLGIDCSYPAGAEIDGLFPQQD